MMSKSLLLGVILLASVATCWGQSIKITIDTEGNPIVKKFFEQAINNAVDLIDKLNSTISSRTAEGAQLLNNIVQGIRDAAANATGSFENAVKNLRTAVANGIQKISDFILNTPLDLDVKLSLGTIKGLLQGLLGILRLPIIG